MAYEITPYPEWSWSHSRKGLLEECPRKYFYHYYASHNGWLKDATDVAKTAYRLKQITNLYLIFGDSVHRIAEMVVRRWHFTSQMQQETELIKRLRAMLNQAYTQALHLKQWQEKPKQMTMLHEIYYHNKLPRDVVKNINDRIPDSIHNLINSTSLTDFINNPFAELLEVEKLNTISIDGSKVYVKIDFMYRTGNTYVVVDWKTGKEDQRNDEQLKLYSYFAHQHYNVPVKNIEIRAEYLQTGECLKFNATSEEIEKTIEEVQTSIRQMKTYLLDAESNIPLAMQQFSGTSRPGICKLCNFREICDVKRS